jgi:hypothetical protein
VIFKRKPRQFHDGEFDIEGENVVSVERSADGNYTLIGLRRCRRQKIDAWYLPVSPEKHADLVRRFRSKLQTRNTPNHEQ